MKLKQIQQERIEQIIKEEMRNLKEGWVSAELSKRNSMFNERNLFEDSSPLQQDLSGDVTFSALEQTASDMASSCMVGFDDEVLKHISSVAKSHGLLSAGDDAGSVYEMIADFDEDSMILAQQECVSDIVAAFEKYTNQITVITAGIFQENNDEKRKTVDDEDLY